MNHLDGPVAVGGLAQIPDDALTLRPGVRDEWSEQYELDRRCALMLKPARNMSDCGWASLMIRQLFGTLVSAQQAGLVLRETRQYTRCTLSRYGTTCK